MAVDLVKKYVTITITSCYIFGSRHPLLVFMFFVLISIYRSFPSFFTILVHASPVIASTLLLLGTLLFFGQKNAPENIENDRKLGSPVDPSGLTQEKNDLGDQKARFQPKNGLKSRDRSRRNSIDDDDNKLWEIGSDHDSDVPRRHFSTDVGSDHSLESGDMVNETDDYDNDYSDDDHDLEIKYEDNDEDENVIMWTEDDQTNVTNIGTSELERNRRLENLVARQKVLRNMRMMAEKNMVNIVGSAPSVMIPLRNSFDFNYDPSDMKYNRVGPTFQTNDPLISRRFESFDVRPTAFGGSKQGYNLGPYFGLANTEDNLSREPYTFGLSKVKTRGGNETGYREKTGSESSSSSFCDVTEDINDDDEEEEFRSIENPPEDLEDLQIADYNHSEEGGLAHTLRSWLTGWKA